MKTIYNLVEKIPDINVNLNKTERNCCEYNRKKYVNDQGTTIERTCLEGINLQVEHDNTYRYTKYYLLDENDEKFPLAVEVDNKTWIKNKMDRWQMAQKILKQLHEINGLKSDL